MAARFPSPAAEGNRCRCGGVFAAGRGVGWGEKQRDRAERVTSGGPAAALLPCGAARRRRPCCRAVR